MQSSKSFVSVYVPEYNGQSKNVFSIKSKIRSIRRYWNRLSRLQKSFLLMLLSTLAILSVTVTTIISAPPSVPYDNEVNHFPKQLALEQDHDNKLKARLPSDVPANDNQLSMPMGSSHADRNNEEWKFPKRPPTKIIQTSLNTLKPDLGQNTKIETWPLKNLISDKAAEDIRHVISLDPVIHIKPKPKTNFSKNLPVKFEGFAYAGPKNPRQEAVVDAFLHAWNGYRKYAWGKDHLRPITKTGGNWFGLGLTLVDSLDTLCIFNLQKEFFEARDWVESSLLFDTSKNVNLFETTIRVLGGLLSAYHLSREQVFLTKAQDLGSRLLSGFKSPSGIPYSDINLQTLRAHGPAWNPDSSTSEVSTLQLEFRDLSRLTNISIFEKAAMNVSEIIHKLPKLRGLVPIHISPSTGEFRSNSVITLGARGDSYYEYLLKQWIQTGKKIEFLKSDYMEAIEGVRDKLVRTTFHSNLTYVGELEQDQLFRPKMDHLVCYLPGTLALGYYNGLPKWHLDLAKSLLFTCYQTYKRQPTGLAPEITYFRTQESDSDFFVKSNDAHNLLRPETVESLWYLYQITGDKMYQDWGFEIFKSFMKFTKTEYGFTSINSVLSEEDVKPRDMMESFFLAETLKYLYLLFSDSDKPVFDLNDWVFNSEAHPLPVHEH